MPITQAFTTVLRKNVPYFRSTPEHYLSLSALERPLVVNGQGAVHNRTGGRYNYPGALTVYLAETVEVCLAERMFYFQREVLQSLDTRHIPGFRVPPSFTQSFVIWEITFKSDVVDILDLTVASASQYNIIPALIHNPSQDYWHLQDSRATIQSNGYFGLRAPSSRSIGGGHLLALFTDQSRNVRKIKPHKAEFRLVTPQPGSVPFVNHATQLLDFSTGEVQIAGNLGGL